MAEAEDPITERLDIIIHKLKFIPDEHRSRVCYIRQTDPLQTGADPYLDEVIRIAGGVPQTDPAAEDFDPAVLLILVDRPVAGLLGSLPAILSVEPWASVDAVRNNRVFLILDPSVSLNPAAPMPADDAEILAEIIHPGYFVFGRDEDAWMQFELA